MVKVRISKEEYVRTEKILNGVPHFQYPDFIEVEAEPVVTFKMDSSYEVPIQNYTGHPLPVEEKWKNNGTVSNDTLDQVLNSERKFHMPVGTPAEEKCEHNTFTLIGVNKWCDKCGVDFPQSPIIEELQIELDGYTRIPSIKEVGDKLNRVIRAVNLLRK